MATTKKDQKNSVTSFSYAERKKSRAVVMKSAVSSKASATKFLKDAGILDKNGNIAKHYK